MKAEQVYQEIIIRSLWRLTSINQPVSPNTLFLMFIQQKYTYRAL